MDVRVKPAGESERALIEGLSQFYIYDFSEMEPAGSPRFEFDGKGGFGGLLALGDYWRKDGHHALLIHAGDRPVGFILVNTLSHRGGTVERNMGEFFVARKHRRHGVASEAVRQVLALYRGRWEVAVAQRNEAAKAFWPRAIASAPNVSGLTHHESDNEHWRGPIWSFVAS